MNTTEQTVGHTAGEWAVITGRWCPEAAQITKVSPKQIRTRRYGSRDSYHQVSDVVFSGTEQQALDLKSVLVGLDARYDQARQQLLQQHRDRIRAAIASAITKATS